LGKRILKDTNRSKSDPDLFKTKSKNNERYGNNRYGTKKKLNLNYNLLENLEAY